MAKTIHQRNKSSPALSTMAQGGGPKPTTKRSAFGDVSNTVNANRPVRDDSIIPTKGGFQVGEKIIPLQQERKMTALLQPAQRPQTAGGLKGLLNNVTNSTLQNTSKSVLTDIRPVPQPANTRKAMTKRSTTIFKETVPVQPDRIIPDSYKPLPAKAPVAPVHRNLDAQHPPIISEPVEKNEQKVRRIQSVSAVQSKSREEAESKAKATANITDGGIHRSDGLYIDNDGNVQIFQYSDETSLIDEPAHGSSKEKLIPASKQTEISTAPTQDSKEPKEKTQNELIKKQTYPPVSEPEEYWDEEDEENYDEDGYATARSFKSKGDNTTGGATTILFPKLNVKTKKEIAAAKQFIESTRTLEEIEDEAWDTSMVAEYGDEIFQYMKELEVSYDHEPKEIHADYNYLDQNAAKCQLHVKSDGNSVVYAVRLDGLACSSPPPLWVASRDLVSLCQLHRSVFVV